MASYHDLIQFLAIVDLEQQQACFDLYKICIHNVNELLAVVRILPKQLHLDLLISSVYLIKSLVDLEALIIGLELSSFESTQLAKNCGFQVFFKYCDKYEFKSNLGPYGLFRDRNLPAALERKLEMLLKP